MISLIYFLLGLCVGVLFTFLFMRSEIKKAKNLYSQACEDKKIVRKLLLDHYEKPLKNTN